LPGGQLHIADAALTGEVIAMIRPESITVVAAESASLSGRVERISFVGDRQRLAVSGATQKTLMIDTLNTLDIKIGENIGLKVDPAIIRVLPREPQ